MRNSGLFKNIFQLLAFPVIIAGCGKETPLRLISTDEASFSSQADVGAGDGAKVAGVGSFSVPTGDALVSRLELGLEGNAKASAGNFLRTLTQVKSNLPKLTDPTKVTGFDQVQLLVYGACSDLTTGGANALMLTKYQVNPTATIAANQTALVNAGLKMLNQYTAGIAGESTATEPIKTALNSLVSQIIADTTNTSIIAFMSVCIAVNTSGSSLLGF